MFSEQFWAVLGAPAVLAVALEHGPASPAQRGLVRIAPCAICPPAAWLVWFASQAELPPADLFATPAPTPAAPHRPSADAWHS